MLDELIKESKQVIESEINSLTNQGIISIFRAASVNQEELSTL